MASSLDVGVMTSSYAVWEDRRLDGVWRTPENGRSEVRVVKDDKLTPLQPSRDSVKKLITTLIAFGLAAFTVYLLGPLQLELPRLGAQGRLSGHFIKVEIEGIPEQTFSGVDGLSAEIEVIEFTDGATRETRKRPGRVKYGDITLKRGVTADRKEMYQWFQDTAQVPEKTQRKSMSIVLFDAAGKETARYNLFECFPKSWHGPMQVTETSALAIEKIEIAIEKVERAR
jgi:phage tail-like protein